MNTKHVLVIGATGLVGTQVVSRLATDPTVHSIICLVRKTPEHHYKNVTYYNVQFDKLDTHEETFDSITHVVCCIGTTIKQAGSKAAFEFVDFDIPKQVAYLAHKNGVQSFSLISSIGASSTSRFFYLQVKGKLETYLKSLSFSHLMIYRPSLLTGKREPARPTETLMALFFSLFSWCTPKSYMPTNSATLAHRITSDLSSLEPGIHIVDSHEI